MSNPQIKGGVTYRTAAGHKVGPIVPTGNAQWPWVFYHQDLRGGAVYWKKDGQTACHGSPHLPAVGYEIEAKWSTRAALLAALPEREG